MIEDQENDFSPQQSLELIESMINRAKGKYAGNDLMYLIWGWVVFICSIIQFLLMHVFNYAQHYMVWLVIIPVSFFQVIHSRKKRKHPKVVNYADAIVGYVWVTFAVVILLLGFLIGFLTTGEYYAHIVHILLAVYGMPIFLTGVIIRFKPLIYGGIGCWVLCIISTFIKVYDYQFLCIPAAMLIAWIIPGYLLRAKYKSE